MSDLINDNINKKQRLGRGLGSLLGAQNQNEKTEQQKTNTNPSVKTLEIKTNTDIKTNEISDEKRIWTIAIDKLVPGEFQPRTQFDKDTLSELSQSIKENGIIQPIIVRKRKAGGYEIIAGERRWRAAQMAGLHEVPAILKEMDNNKALEQAIIENIQREDLNPIDEALAYKRLAEEFSLTQNQISEKVGKDRATIANSIRVLSLPQFIQEEIKNKSISLGHAKVLLSCQKLEQLEKLVKKIKEGQLSVRATEKLVTDVNLDKLEIYDPQNDKKNIAIKNLTDLIQKKLGTKVQIDYKNGKGNIKITFYSDEEFNNLTQKLI